MAGALWETGLGLFFPNVCQLCGEGRAAKAGGYVCEACAATVRWVEPPFCSRCGRPALGAVTTEYQCAHCAEGAFAFSSARAAAFVEPLVLEVIHRYKYNRALYFEPFLARLLSSRVGAQRDPKWDLIAPVPLHPVKLREREFNQAERLARRLGEHLGLPVRTDLVRRVVATPSQTRLSRKERAENMRNAFAPRRENALHGERVLLIDDILTTGATTSACARALLDAGAGDVAVWAVARGAPDSPRLVR